MSEAAPIRVSEIFGPTIQGEGVLIGEPTVFVRAGGCDYRCVWCDTPHAVDASFRDEWRPLSAQAIWQEVERLSGGRPLTVSLSGGNPAIQPFGPLIAQGRAAGYRFALETQGSIARDWFADLDTLVLSPKPPSSRMATDWTALEDCLAAAGAQPRVVLKFVVFDAADYAFAKDAAARHPALPVFLQPGNPVEAARSASETADLPAMMDRMRWLVERTLADGWFAPRILPQLHALIWGHRKGV